MKSASACEEILNVYRTLYFYPLQKSKAMESCPEPEEFSLYSQILLKIYINVNFPFWPRLP
jgi:hypothetical protein